MLGIDHMHIFKDGRAPFLEFLRNLTPQAVVLSFALIAGHRLQLSCCDPGNVKLTLLWVCFSLIWFVSVWANSSLFIEKYLVSVKRIDDEAKRLSNGGVKGFRNLRALLTFAWRHERLIFLEAVFVFAVVEFGLVVVSLSGISSATAILKVLHG